jgi:hypothetical protein
MQIYRTIKLGKRGTKILMREYGERLICVRYRYDRDTHKRYKTVELIVNHWDWNEKKPDTQGKSVGQEPNPSQKCETPSVREKEPLQKLSAAQDSPSVQNYSHVQNCLNTDTHHSPNASTSEICPLHPLYPLHGLESQATIATTANVDIESRISMPQNAKPMSSDQIDTYPIPCNLPSHQTAQEITQKEIFWFRLCNYIPNLFEKIHKLGVRVRKGKKQGVWGVPLAAATELGLLDHSLIKRVDNQ